MIADFGFAYQDEVLSTKGLPDDVKSQLERDTPRIIGEASGYPVIFVAQCKVGKGDVDRQLIRLGRAVVKKLSAKYQDASILIVASHDFSRIHFVNAKRIGKRLLLRRYFIGAEEKMRTAVERLLHLKVKGDESWADMLQKVEQAFDREAVTERFFKDFEGVFRRIKQALVQQRDDEQAAHHFTHSLLNRLLFIYFVQRKGWDCVADGDPEFIKSLWDAYNDGDYKNDTFYEDWLKTLFFSAFNNQHGYENKGLPKDVVTAFKRAPYLDGGLFRPSSYDGMGFKVTDAMFEDVFDNVLDHYNFTVAEDTPFDQNIAVDPEMLGIVYESLVNTSELTDKRAEAGIFYTPRVEVDFMCRLSLVEYLDRHTSASREDIYRFLFSEEEEEIVPEFGKKVLGELDKALLEVTVVDPACGSAAFLVGMMQVIMGLRRELARQAGKGLDEFVEKRRIIERSLYGVDVKSWAISIAQLRLWLTLIEVADEKQLDLMGMKAAEEPLLPSLSFKLRVGDSLVQEIAGVTLPTRSVKGNLSAAVKRKVTELHNAKTNYYFNRPGYSEHQLRQKELGLYETIIAEKIAKLDDEMEEVRKPMKAAFQEELTATLKSDTDRAKDYRAHQDEEDKKRQRRLDELAEEKAQLIEIMEKLPEKQQLFWSIEFAEIFQDRGGFDIVISNPPYVKLDWIDDPNRIAAGEQTTAESRSLYKKRLQRAVDDDWLHASWAIDKKSDLYVYFYLKGLALLNPLGVLSYVSSSSWLDVGYGTGLQRFLLRNTRVHLIADNSAKKIFRRAEINAVIVLISQSSSVLNSDRAVRFVYFHKPYEQLLYSDLLLAVENAKERIELSYDDNKSEPYVSIIPIDPKDLYSLGTATDQLVDGHELELGQHFTAKYFGSNWGAGLLRAPYILNKLKEQLAPFLTQLSELVTLRNGCQSSINEFFYLENDHAAKLEIEKEYLRPLLRNTAAAHSLNFSSDLDWVVFVCWASKEKLRQLSHHGALSYIRWGEAQTARKRQKRGEGVPYPEVASVGRRKPGWWAVPELEVRFAHLFMQYVIGSRFIVPICMDNVTTDRCFHRIWPHEGIAEESLAAVLSSSLTLLFIMTNGRAAMGMGAFKHEVSDANRLLVLDVRKLNSKQLLRLHEALFRIGSRPIGSILSELKMPDRRALDNVVFDILGLTEEEREEVYSEEERKLLEERLSDLGYLE
ncbi:Eco57I restriction-modification methylase domain-containing protein [bacterium]|nr:Eco57I restriction-modification methylase domain-containing protein [bacterium]